MYIVSAKLTFYIPHSTSLKDKRQVCRSIIDKTRGRFNVSIAEVDTQELHQILTVGFAVISGSLNNAQKYADEIVRFVDGNTDAELTEVEINQ